MFNSTRQKKKIFGGYSETVLEVYLCTGKQKKRFRREKLHRRFRDISHIQCFTDFNQKKKKRLHRRFSTSLFLSCHPTFKASQILTKKKKKKLQRTSSTSEHLCFYLAKTEVYPKTLSYLIFDHFSAFILLS